MRGGKNHWLDYSSEYAKHRDRVKSITIQVCLLSNSKTSDNTWREYFSSDSSETEEEKELTSRVNSSSFRNWKCEIKKETESVNLSGLQSQAQSMVRNVS